MFFPKRSRWPPHFFYISDIANSSSFNGKIFRKKSMLEKFRANVLKRARWPLIFFQVFAKNSLIENMFEEEKQFDGGTRFFSGNSSQLGVFWPRRGLQANHGTVRKSAIFPQPINHKQLKWSNAAYVNKRSFAFKIKLRVFQVTKT